MVVGHEYVGEVVGIGQEVRGFEIGDRVSGEGHITCGHCRNCRGGRTHLCRNTTGVGVNRTGAFSEFLVIPAFNAFKIPAEISDDLASIFDPFGNAVHTALSFAPNRPILPPLANGQIRSITLPPVSRSAISFDCSS